MVERRVLWGIVVVAVVGLAFIAVGLLTSGATSPTSAPAGEGDQPLELVAESHPNDAAMATFAGGCFWCTEAAFQETPGVSNAISGYAGGQEFDPTYEAVYTGATGHREALRVYYDPKQVTYEELLAVYWQSIDPTDAGGQFVDRGMPYTTAIYVHDEQQRAAAQASLSELEGTGRLDGPVVTEVLPFSTFYEAEEYHQDFYLKSSDRYEAYTGASGRQDFKERVWGEIQKSQ
ncbi:peptide-methionine (S)-S-oxide reductase MsrA [Candidatus Nanopelagicales bacterium]|nr:peptide-methionine (S)-S-oxide reductase MsrA [Candidatus Nanopelagicales bacterium]